MVASKTFTQQAIMGLLLPLSSDGVTASAGYLDSDTIAVGGPTVTQTPTPSAAVVVGPAVWVIPGPASSTQGRFLWTPPGAAAVTVPVSPGSGSNPRIDLLTIQVTDPGTETTPGWADFVIVEGTPAASPTAPPLPTGALLVRNIARGANDTVVTNAQITGAPFRSSLRSNPRVGRGRVTGARRTADSLTFGSTEGMLDAASFTYDPQRRYEVTWTGFVGASVAGAAIGVRIRAAASGSVNTSSPQIGQGRAFPPGVGANAPSLTVTTEILPGTFAAGQVTVGIGLVRESGSGTGIVHAGSTYPATLSVKDVGM